MLYSGMKDLIDSYSRFRGITKREAEIRLKDVLEVIRMELLNPKRNGVQLINFLTLRKKVRKPKLGRNPNNPNNTYDIPEQVGLKLELGKEFRDSFNEVHN